MGVFCEHLQDPITTSFVFWFQSDRSSYTIVSGQLHSLPGAERGRAQRLARVSPSCGPLQRTMADDGGRVAYALGQQAALW